MVKRKTKKRSMSDESFAELMESYAQASAPFATEESEDSYAREGISTARVIVIR